MAEFKTPLFYSYEVVKDMRNSTKQEKETILKIVQKETGRKQPRRYLFKMLDLVCMYFVGYENRSKNWLKEQIDDYFG